MPRVSVLLTCYNHLPHLPQALESVRAQTYADYEILAIDDGSTDGTREWLSAQPDIHCIFNASNLGTYETLNVGLREATGEFIAVLNDDDVWAPEKLARQVALLDAQPKIGLVQTGGRFIDDQGNTTQENPLGFEYPTFTNGDRLLDLVYRNLVIASAALARRACFEEVGEFNRDYFGSGDWEMWFRIAERYQLGFVEGPLTMYRLHAANASHQSDRIGADDVRLREWMAERLERVGDRFPADAVRKAKAFNLAALGVVRARRGDKSGARKALSASLRLEPTRIKTFAHYLRTLAP